MDWIWRLDEDCAFGYLDAGGIVIHICSRMATDAAEAAGAAGAVLGYLVATGVIAISGTALSGFGAALSALLVPIWIFCRDDEGNLDIFIDPASTLIMQGLGPFYNVSVLILETKYYMTFGENQ